MCCDVARSHLHPEDLQAAADAGLWMVIIPALCTWFLQPLDVYVFARLKQRLKDITLERMGSILLGANCEVIIGSLIRAAEDILTQKDWSHAFHRLGLTGELQPTSRSLCSACAWEDAPITRRERPSEPQLAVAWPRRSIVPFPALLAALPAPAPPAAALPPAAPLAIADAPASDAGSFPRRRLVLL